MKNIKIILAIIYCVIANTTFAQFEPYKFSEKEKEESYLCEFLDGCLPKFTCIPSDDYFMYFSEKCDLEIIKFVKNTVRYKDLKTVAVGLCNGEFDDEFILVKTEYGLNYDDETNTTDTVYVAEYYKSKITKNFIMQKGHYVERDEYGKLKPRTYDDCIDYYHRIYYLKSPNNIVAEFDSDHVEFAIKDIWGE
ncbi:MAG: hypothetical protein II937_11915 [Bacteroidales bacterium]|nr:hypothetical protein [Bacteroidales bacterium]